MSSTNASHAGDRNKPHREDCSQTLCTHDDYYEMPEFKSRLLAGGGKRKCMCVGKGGGVGRRGIPTSVLKERRCEERTESLYILFFLINVHLHDHVLLL